MISLSKSQAEARSKNDTGLNQPITDQTKADKGWEYNPGKNLLSGIDKAVADRKANPNIHDKLKAALSENLAVAAKVIESQAKKPIAEKMPVVNKKEFADYVEKVTHKDYKARHEFIQAGVLPNFVMADSAVIALEPVNNEIHGECKNFCVNS